MNLHRQPRTNLALRPPARAALRAMACAVLALFALAHPVPAADAARAAAADTRRVLLFFGDSLTAGHGLEDPAAQAYPAVIQQKIDAAHLPWRVVNAGLSGETSAAGLRRVDWVLRQHVDLFFLALGANDGLRGIDPAVTKKNLEQIIARVRAKDPSARIVLGGMRMPPGMGEDYTHRFDAIFPEISREMRIPVVPFLLEGVALRPDLNQPDGIHPTAAGARLVAENVWKVIRPLL